MPFNYGDVSVHDTKTLAKLLGALKRGEDWKPILEHDEYFTKYAEKASDSMEDFLALYHKMNTLLKTQAARDMKKEDELHGS